MAYANPGVFLQALQGAAQQHRMVLTKSLTTFATHQRSKTRYDISIQIYTKQSVYMCIYIHCNIYIYICIVYVDNEKLINIYKTLQVCKYVYIYIYIYVCTYIYVCIYIYMCMCATSLCVIISYRCMYIYMYIN